MKVTKSKIRDDFRKEIFKRDNDRCVVPSCWRHAEDAHHLIERRLWTSPDEHEGYIPDNCVSLCHEHHKCAEQTYIPPQALREWAGITRVVLPEGFAPNKIYDKWGGVIPRAPRSHIKYPHTNYLNFSPGVDNRDFERGGFFDITNFVGKEIDITVKMDGSNVCLTSDKVVARNGSCATHTSFDMLKALHANIKHTIPERYQIFGEWLYAKHSIAYSGKMKIPDYLMVFAIYDKQTELFLSDWDVREICHRLELQRVPQVGYNICSDNANKLVADIIKIGNKAIANGHEGIVVRSSYPFHYGNFSQNIAKFVRENHVSTDTHWSHQKIVRNELDGRKRNRYVM